MAIFNSYVKLPEGKPGQKSGGWILSNLDPSFAVNCVQKSPVPRLQHLMNTTTPACCRCTLWFIHGRIVQIGYMYLMVSILHLICIYYLYIAELIAAG